MSSPSFEGFRSSLKEFFNTDNLSDLIVACNGNEFKVHQLILCAHSKYFAKQLNGLWKESSEKVITIEDFDSSIVEAMLYFLYNFDYTNVSGTSTMVFDAQVYQIADKYGIQALKSYAKDRFYSTINVSWRTDDFSLAINVVYTTTPQDDRGLRDLVVEVSHKNIKDLVVGGAFCGVLRSTVDFAADLVPFLSNRPSTKLNEYQCPSCYKAVKFAYIGNYAHCPQCGNGHSKWSSHKLS